MNLYLLIYIFQLCYIYVLFITPETVAAGQRLVVFIVREMTIMVYSKYFVSLFQCLLIVIINTTTTDIIMSIIISMTNA